MRDSLPDRVIADIERWWTSLTPEQQNQINNDPDSASKEFDPLPDFDDLDPDDECYPIYEYLVNHELRIVGFVAEEQQDDFHKFVSCYLASLGSDYRHGGRGTVQ